MSGRSCAPVAAAVSYALRTKCKPVVAARAFGCSVTSVRRGLRAAGVKPNPVGRPRRTPGDEAF